VLFAKREDAEPTFGKFDGKSDLASAIEPVLQAPGLLEIAIDLTRRETAILTSARRHPQMVETLQQFACMVEGAWLLGLRWRDPYVTTTQPYVTRRSTS